MIAECVGLLQSLSCDQMLFSLGYRSLLGLSKILLLQPIASLDIDEILLLLRTSERIKGWFLGYLLKIG